MDYREYIESITPDDELKIKSALRVKRARRAAFVKPALAVAVLIVIFAGTLFFTQSKGNAPSDKIIESTTEQTTEHCITTYTPDETLKSALLVVTFDSREYIEVRNERVEVKVSDLTEYTTVAADNLTDGGEELLGATVYKIKNDSRIIIAADGEYYLFREI